MPSSPPTRLEPHTNSISTSPGRQLQRSCYPTSSLPPARPTPCTSLARAPRVRVWSWVITRPEGFEATVRLRSSQIRQPTHGDMDELASRSDHSAVPALVGARQLHVQEQRQRRRRENPHREPNPRRGG